LRVFENRVLRRIFGPKREEVAGGWRWLHNEELHNLYTSPNITRVIKSRRMRWVQNFRRKTWKEDITSWQASSHSACQEISRLLWNPKVHYLVHKSQPLLPVLSQTHPAPTFPPYSHLHLVHFAKW
jgi:hypothetical protein